MKYIVTEYRKDLKRTYYVCARPGWFMRLANGSQAKDGSLIKGGPEWTLERSKALEFTNKLSAARVKGKCPSAKVEIV